jgi:hypothetical protein
MMKCEKCGKEADDSAAFCPGCGTALTSQLGKAPSEVTIEWLREVMAKAGYTTTPSEKTPETLICKHERRSNVQLRIQRDLGLITGIYWWKLQKPGWGGEAKLLAAINQANANAWRQTYAMDKEGDLVVSFYILLANRLSETDILQFLEREQTGFTAATSTTLKDFMK